MNQNIKYSLLFPLVLFFFISLKNVYAVGPSLSVSPSSATHTVGQIFTVDIVLDTAGVAIDAVELTYLHYNPAMLQIQDSNISLAGAQIIPGTLLSSTSSNSVDTTSGTVQFSQGDMGGNTFNGTGKLASIRFKATAVGTSAVTINFSPGSIVASGGVDKLATVGNASYTVTASTSGTSSGGGGGGHPPTPPPPPPTQSPPPPASAQMPLLVLTRALSITMSGDDVKLLQTILIQKGYLTPDNATGYFGTFTQAAVRKYQCDKSIVCTGTEATTGYGSVGKKTTASLNGSASSSPTPPSYTRPAPPVTGVRNLYYGLRGDDVKTLQEYLIAKGYLADGEGNNSGYFGNLTKLAVQKFQTEHNIKSSGYFGAITRAAAGI